MHLYLTILLCFVFTGLVSAQEDALTPYEVALERIAEAEVSGATELDLTYMNMGDLPPEIGNLSNLRELYLQYSQLNSLPAEIGNLNNLRYLSLYHNQLNSIPAEIGNLNNLQVLHLESNQLSNLPPEIGNLDNLQFLSVLNNQLNSIPAEIGNLDNLEYLNLGNNQINNLPTEIAQIDALCYLNISDNQLRRLPHQLGQLTQFTSSADCLYPYDEGLYIGGNPLISPPDEVLAQGTEAILAYLRNPLWWHLQEVILGVASCIGVLMSVVLVLNWRNQRGKRKRKHDALQ